MTDIHCVGIESADYENALFKLRSASGLANTIGTLLMSGGDASEVDSSAFHGTFFSIELALKEACALLEQTKLVRVADTQTLN